MTLLVSFLVIFLAIYVGRIVYFGLIAKFVGKKTTAFNQHPQNPTIRILCVGDSIGVGVGSTSPDSSFFGLLGQNLPTALITNYCKNGLNTIQVLEYLKSKDLKNYDMAIAILGGMDVIKMTNIDSLEKTLEDLLSLLKNHAKRIILVPPHNTGLLPMYHFPLTGILNWRAKKVEELFTKIGKLHFCVITSQDFSRLLLDKKKYFSIDKAHPNDLGYALWFDTIKHVFKNLV